MLNRTSNCVLLADRHHGLRDSVRGLLETEFDMVFMVATEASLLEGAARLDPAVVVFDLSLSAGNLTGLLGRIGTRAPGAKLMLLSVHDEPSIATFALAAGADAVVLKRCLATDLMPAVGAVRAGQQYLSPALSPFAVSRAGAK